MGTTRPLVYGLTGGIACGKSTLARALRQRGATVIDADALAREAVARGSEGLRLVVEAFGPDVLASSGELDRAALADIVFHDEARRSILNAIVHPRVRELSMVRIGEALAAGAVPVFYEAALLFETGADALFPEVVVVGCAPEVQRSRLMLRDGLNELDADARINAQMSLEEKRAKASYYIDNSTSESAMSEAADALLAWSKTAESERHERR